MNTSPFPPLENAQPLLSELAAAADQAAAVTPSAPSESPEYSARATAILNPDRRLAREYLAISAAALRNETPASPLNRCWAQQTGAFLTQAFDALFAALAAASHSDGNPVPGHAEIRVQTMVELNALEQEVSQDLDWPLFTTKILGNYRNLPRW